MFVAQNITVGVGTFWQHLISGSKKGKTVWGFFFFQGTRNKRLNRSIYRLGRDLVESGKDAGRVWEEMNVIFCRFKIIGRE